MNIELTRMSTRLGMTAVLVIAGAGQAQEDAPLVDNTDRSASQPGDMTISLRGGVEYQFDTDIDDGGEFNKTTVEGGVSVHSILSDMLSLVVNFD